jgi:fucose permease
MRGNLILLATSLAAFLMMGMGQSIYGPALPAFARELRIGDGTASMLISAHWIGCALGVAVMFWQGARIVPAHALTVMAAGGGVVALGQGFALTLTGAVVFGTGYGAATVLINPRLLTAFGPRGAAMVSLANACFAVGAIVAPMVFVWLGSDPALSYAVVAVAAVAVMLLSLAVPPAPVPLPSATGRFDPHLRLLIYPAFGVGLESLLIGLGPLALIAAGQTEVAAAQFLSLFFVAFLAARVGLIFVAHRVPAFVFYLGAMAGVTVLAALTLVTLSPWPFVLMGACAGLFFPTVFVAATDVMGQDPRVPSVIIAAGLIGGILLPLILGPALPQVGANGFFFVILVIGAAMSTLGLIRGRRVLIVPPASP